MFSTLTLLSFTPVEALLVLINDKLGTSFSPKNVEITSVVPTSETEAEVTILGKETEFSRIVPNSYEGELTFAFNRLLLQDVFGADYSLNTSYPTTVSNVLDIISRFSKIQFDEHDFEQGIISSNTYLLKANDSSRRWCGEINLTLIDESQPAPEPE